MKKYIMSGIGPSEDGTGKLMTALIPMAEERGYQTFVPQMNIGFTQIIASRSLPGLIIEIKKRLFQYIKLFCIRNSEIILIHPQTFGFWRLFSLYKRKNSIKLYIVDNSFFCIQSYNYRSNKEGECLDCLGNPDVCNEICSPFPVRYAKKKNLSYLKKLKKIYRDFSFYVQNSYQGLLLQKHFGEDVQFKIIGLLTDEFIVPERFSKKKRVKKEFDMVYHGNPVEAKGILYVIKLAGYLPEFSILIPSDKDEILNVFPNVAIPDNVVCKNIRWKSGLKKVVENSGLILCPSLWSAPIEGALIKSIIHNGNVAVCNTRYGFQREVPKDVLLRLDQNLKSSAQIIRRFYNKSEDLSSASQKWVSGFIGRNKVADIFN